MCMFRRRRSALSAVIGLALAAASPCVAQPAVSPTGTPPVVTPPTATLTDAEMVRALVPSVVNIRVIATPQAALAGRAAATPDAGPAAPRVMSGSGFVVDPSGLIVTNQHVVDGAYDITVTFANGESEPAQVVDAIRMLDLAVLRVPGDRPRSAVRWADPATVLPGDEVFALGNPLGIGMSVSAGIVSALNRNIQETRYDHFIQTDTVINHGNSGGPLFNTRGEVVGVNTAIISPTAGYAGLGFAIPVDTVRFVIDRVERYGWLRPGWIGIRTTTVTRDIALADGDARAEGMMVSAVAADSPAAKAGLRIGDIVLRFGTVAPADQRALQRAIIAAPIDEVVPILMRRAGTEQTVAVRIAEWPLRDYERENGGSNERKPMTVRRDLGLTFASLTDAARARHGLQPQQTGVLISGVMAGTDAWVRGIVEGDVVLQVQDVPVTSGAAVQQQIDRARTAGRSFVRVLVQEKDGGPEEPRWIALRVIAARPEVQAKRGN